MSILISGGKLRLICSIFSFKSRQICTVFAPDCFIITKRTPSRLLIFSSSVKSLMVSRTVARSRTYTCLPVWVVVTTTFSISALSRYSLRTCTWYCSSSIFTLPDAIFKLLALIALPTSSSGMR